MSPHDRRQAYISKADPTTFGSFEIRRYESTILTPSTFLTVAPLEILRHITPPKQGRPSEKDSAAGSGESPGRRSSNKDFLEQKNPTLVSVQRSREVSPRSSINCN